MSWVFGAAELSTFKLLCVGHGKDINQSSLVLATFAKVTSAQCPVDTCAHLWQGRCLRARSAPGQTVPGLQQAVP